MRNRSKLTVFSLNELSMNNIFADFDVRLINILFICVHQSEIHNTKLNSLATILRILEKFVLYKFREN